MYGVSERSLCLMGPESPAARLKARSLRTMLAEECRHPRDVEDVDVRIGRVGSDAVAGRGRRNGPAEISREGCDVKDVREAVVVEVSRPGVDSALSAAVRPGE